MDELLLRTDSASGVILEPGVSYEPNDQMLVLHIGRRKIILYPAPFEWVKDLRKCLDNLIRTEEGFK